MEPFIGMIVMFGGNFAPRNWALCDGQLLSINANTALFSILGTTFGGDGRTTFGLPELRGRVATHAGTGPGLPNMRLGQKGGSDTVTLNVTQMPSHNHTGVVRAHDDDGNSPAAAGNVLANAPNNVYSTAAADENMAGNSVNIANNGGGQAHNNMQPYQAVNYIIALVGIYPSRS